MYHFYLFTYETSIKVQNYHPGNTLKEDNVPNPEILLEILNKRGEEWKKHQKWPSGLGLAVGMK